MRERVTANLPSRDFDVTEAFYAKLGFEQVFRGDSWMILKRGENWVEFFPHPELDPFESWFSACLRVDDLDALHAEFASAGLTDNPESQHLSPPQPAADPVPPMFAFLDPDRSLWRCIEATS